MDIQDWLQSVVGDCSLLSEPAEALVLIPDIGVDAPPLVPLQLDGQGIWGGFPAVYAPRLRGPLARLIAAELGRWKEGGAPDALSVARPELLVEDELVAAVTELIAEACAHDRRLASGVMLEVARQSALLVAGRIDEWDGLADVLSLPRLASELGQAPLQDQARAYQALTWALTGRLSAAWALAAQLDPDISPTRFYQAMVANKLVFTHPAGSLDSASCLGLIAALEGVELEAEHLSSAYLAVLAAVQKVLAGGDDALSQSLRDMMGSRKNPTALALDPSLAAVILHQLDELLDARAIKSAGVSKRDLKALQKGPGIAAISAAYTRCVRVLRCWDLLSAAAGRSVVVSFRGVAAETRLGRLEPSARWGLLVPRGGGGITQSTVVALDFSALNRYVATHADRSPGLTLGLAAYRHKLARIAARIEGVAGRSGSFELFVFTHPGSAEAFLRQVQDSLSAIHLDRGPFGRPTPVASDIWVQSHTASGEVMGGWDGSALRIWGPAVDEACRSAAGPPGEGDYHGAMDDSLESVGSLLSRTAASTSRAHPRQASPPAGALPPQPKPPEDPFATMGDPFSQEIPAAHPEHDRAPPGPQEDPFSSMEIAEDDESEEALFGAGETFIIESPEDSSEEEDPDFDNPFDDEARTALTDIGTLRASGANQDLIDTAREALQERAAPPAPEPVAATAAPLGDPIDVEGLEATDLDPFGDHEITELSFGDPDELEQTELPEYDGVAAVSVSAAAAAVEEAAPAAGGERSLLEGDALRPLDAREGGDDPVSGVERAGDDHFFGSLPDAPGAVDAFDDLVPTQSVLLEALPAAPAEDEALDDPSRSRGGLSIFDVPAELEPLSDDDSGLSDVVMLDFAAGDGGSAAPVDEPADDASDFDEPSEIGEAVLVGFDEPADDAPGFDEADEPSEIGEAVLVGFDEPADDAPDFDEPSEIGEAVLVGFDEPADDASGFDEADEPSEIGEAVLVGFDEPAEELPGGGAAEAVEDEFSEAERTIEIVDDEGSEYEYVFDEDSELDEPNTDLDGYFLPGEVADSEALAAGGDQEFYLPPPEEPSRDEITFNVLLTREPSPEEDVEDSRTFDLDLDVGVSEAAAEALDESTSDPSSEAILSLDDGPLDLPGEPPDADIYREGSDFVLSDPDSGASGGDSLSWLEQAEEALDEASTGGDSYDNSSAALPDLEYLFQGYVVFMDDGGTVCFGRRYGKRLLDVHAYDVRGKIGSAYQSFLNDKVSEGFVPRADLTRSMPSDVPVEAVDLEEMGRAFRVLAAR